MNILITDDARYPDSALGEDINVVSVEILQKASELYILDEVYVPEGLLTDPRVIASLIEHARGTGTTYRMFGESVDVSPDGHDVESNVIRFVKFVAQI